MLNDAFLAFFHFLAIFILVTLLAAEAVVLRPGMTPAIMRRLSLYDLFYFLSAMVGARHWPASAVLRCQGRGFLPAQPVVPRQGDRLRADCPVLAAADARHRALAQAGTQAARFRRPMPDEIKRARRWVMIEAHVFILLPLCAVMMARGIGAR